MRCVVRRGLVVGGVPGPDAAQRRLIAARAPTSATQLVEAINDAVGRFGAVEPELLRNVIDTRSQRELFNALWTRCSALNEGAFKGRLGPAGETLVGAKGIGKSRAMRTFNSVCSTVFPDVVSVYVTYSSEGGALTGVPLFGAIQDALKDELGWTFAPRRKLDHLCAPLLTSLADNNRRLFLMVDEIDMLYETPTADSQATLVALGTLKEIASLSAQGSGLVATVLCGSSSIVDSLIRNDAPSTFADKYQLVKSGPTNLNRTKYKSYRINAPLPTDVNAVRTITGFSVEDARKVCFAVGATARDVETLMLFPDKFSLLTHGNNGSKLLADEIKVFESLRDILLEKNKELVSVIKPHGIIDLNVVAKYTWELEYTPVSLTELTTFMAPCDASSVSAVLMRLVDRSCVCVDDVYMSQPGKIYIRSLLELVLGRRDISQWAHLQEQLKPSIELAIKAVKAAGGALPILGSLAGRGGE